MTGLVSLWLPILLSAVIVFIASSLIHMVLPWHKSDYPKMPNEDAVADALRPMAIPAGDYMFPRPTDMADMKSPAFAEKMKRGPVVMMTVMPNGQMGMGRNLALWFVYCCFISLCSAYIACHALPPASGWHQVFRFVGLSAFLGYVGALWQMTIWYHRGLGLTIKSSVDGLIYALLTAATFCWLWPR